MSIAQVVEDLFTLRSNVQSLNADVKRISDMVLDHHGRIIRLENSGDLVMERAKNASMEQVLSSYQIFAEKISGIEAKLNGQALRLPVPDQ